MQHADPSYRLRSNIQKLKAKLIDTSALVNLFKQTKERMFLSARALPPSKLKLLRLELQRAKEEGERYKSEAENLRYDFVEIAIVCHPYKLTHSSSPALSFFLSAANNLSVVCMNLLHSERGPHRYRPCE